MDHSQEDFQKLQQFFEILCKMLGFGKDITEALLTKYQRDYKEDRGLRSILNFINHGGKVEQITINTEQADMFRQRLQDSHVSYYETVITRDDNTKQHLFMYKGVTVHNDKEIATNDKLQVEQIKKMFELELSCNSKELDAHTFKSLMKHKPIGLASNLTTEQVYAFRNNVKDADLKFCVLKDKDNTYKIYADDKKKLTDVLVRVCYDLANDKNDVFKNAAVNYADKKHKLYDRCGKEAFIICDKKNPNNFIHIGKHNYSLHSFKQIDEIQPDGSVKQIVRDTARPQVLDLDKEKIFNLAKQFNNPIAVPVDNFTLLSDINKSGVAFASVDIEKDYVKFIEYHKDDDLVIEKYPRKMPRHQIKDLMCYSHLTYDIVQKIKQDMPFVHADEAGNIAFEKTHKDEVDKYLQDNVFKNIQDPMQRLAYQCKINNRCGDFTPQLSKPLTADDEPFYIINPDNGNKISIDLDGLHVYDNDKEIACYQPEAEEYKQYLQQYTDIPNPVMLTYAEMQADNCNEIIADRANNYNESNPAIQYMLNIEEMEKQELIDNIDHTEDVNMSSEQKEAEKSYNKMHLHSRHADRAIFSEMQDLAINKDMSKDEDIDL